jgi:cysteine synthase
LGTGGHITGVAVFKRKIYLKVIVSNQNYLQFYGGNPAPHPLQGGAGFIPKKYHANV